MWQARCARKPSNGRDLASSAPSRVHSSRQPTAPLSGECREGDIRRGSLGHAEGQGAVCVAAKAHWECTLRKCLRVTLDRYVFYGRPAESDTLPRQWCEAGAPVPYAILEASSHGLRVIHPSLAGQLARLVATLGVGLGLLLGLFLPSAILASRIGVTYVTWFLPTALVLVIVALPLGILARKLVGWRPVGPGIRLTVVAISPGVFRQQLQVEGEGGLVWLSTVALSSTLFSALKLARQLPPDSAIGR